MKAKILLVSLIGLFVLSGCSSVKFQLLNSSEAFFVPKGTEVLDITTIEPGYYFSNTKLEQMGIDMVDK